ncbi:hypothetical protein BJ085DRAFT_15098, partial [Dimargaris cristalligena]
MPAVSTPAANTNWAPNAAESSFFQRLFQQVDTTHRGHITGQEAVPFFTRSQLPAATLGEIWELADQDRKGALGPSGFSIALKLIALAQKGERPTLANLNQVVPLPLFEGITPDPPAASRPEGPVTSARSTTASPSPFSAADTRASARSLTPSQSSEILSETERNKYRRLFQNCHPKDGLLDGESARQVLMKSKLSVETLGQIWGLADTHRRGSLDLTDFMIAMYYVQRMMEGRLARLPTEVPDSLIASARGTEPPPVNRSVFSPDLSTFEPASTPAWDIGAKEKARADQFFALVDTQKHGYVGGEEAVQFFLKSELPEADLAAVWDLADHEKSGRLNREEFAVALHLINGLVAGRKLPTRLPESLV